MIINYRLYLFQENDDLVSLLDIVPTVLDWMDIKYPKYSLFQKKTVSLTGESLLPLLAGLKESTSQQNVLKQNKTDKHVIDSTQHSTVYASHNLHEITMYYPMRAIRTQRYKLIKNFNYLMPFPIDQDFYISPTFQDLLNRTMKHEPLHWIKTLHDYYYRDAFELYDLYLDPKEMVNVVHKQEYEAVVQDLVDDLEAWQAATDDPWRCSPTGVLEDSGDFKVHPQCMTMYNGLKVSPGRTDL